MQNFKPNKIQNEIKANDASTITHKYSEYACKLDVSAQFHFSKNMLLLYHYGVKTIYTAAQNVDKVNFLKAAWICKRIISSRKKGSVGGKVQIWCNQQ